MTRQALSYCRLFVSLSLSLSLSLVFSPLFFPSCSLPLSPLPFFSHFPKSRSPHRESNSISLCLFSLHMVLFSITNMSFLYLWSQTPKLPHANSLFIGVSLFCLTLQAYSDASSSRSRAISISSASSTGIRHQISSLIAIPSNASIPSWRR